MFKAMLMNGTIVTAEEVKVGVYSRTRDFVDPEYKFRVTYVKSSKNDGQPYFRLYYSYNDYCSMTQERKEQFDYLRKMSHYDESIWHKEWESKVSSFAKIEEYIKNGNKQRKRADAYIEFHKTIIEFQHSFGYKLIFSERNAFYKELGLNIIWLFDLTSSEINEEDNKAFVVEDNSNMFFRIADQYKLDVPVYIQTNNRNIYRVHELKRKEIENEYQSTVRYFNISEKYIENDFVRFLQDGAKQEEYNTAFSYVSKDMSILILKNRDGKYYKFFLNNGHIRNSKIDDYCVIYKYVTEEIKGKYYPENLDKVYSLSISKLYKKDWTFCMSYKAKKGDE